MGLRTASVRRPHVVVMAPALTETTQSQNYKLSSSEHLQVSSPINSLHEHNVYITSESGNRHKSDENLNRCLPNDKGLSYELDVLNTLTIATEISNGCSGLSDTNDASDNNFVLNQTTGTIMNNSPLSMGDQGEKMGLQKTDIDTVSTVLKDKAVSNDVDQLFGNLSSVLPVPDLCNTADIVQNDDDIMQVIKCMEVNNERLSNPSSELGGEGDAMFTLSSSDLTGNLSSFEKELLNDVDMMSIGIDEQLIDGATSIKESQTKEYMSDLEKKQAKMERRLEFLYRRARKMQSHLMGQHFSGEVAGVFEFVHRTLRKLKDNSVQQMEAKQLDPSTSTSVPIASTSETVITPEKIKPMSQASTKSLMRKLEMSLLLQSNSASRQRHAARYFGSGTLETNPIRNNSSSMFTVPQWPVETKNELQKVSGLLNSELGLVQSELDSEATASSSGGESCDEMQNYNNPYQHYLRIQKRASWRYLTDRAAIAARWTWLQAQISDLEYRIRQHSDMHRKIRSNKGTVTLGGVSPPHSISSSPSAVNGYRGQLPGSLPLTSKASDSTANGAVPNYADCQSARTRPLINFRKRKLLQTNGLHAVSKKAARPSTIRCGCVPPTVPCALCTGRTDPTHPRDLADNLSKPERIALLDPSFHPVFSLPEDTSAGIHFEAIVKIPEWQQRSTRSNIKIKALSKQDRLDKTNIPLDQRPKKLDHRKKYSRLLKTSTVNALSAKIKNKLRGRRPGRHSQLNRIGKKRHPANVAIAQLQALAADNVDDEVDAIGANAPANISKLDSPSTSPLLPLQSVSGYSRRNRIDSYDIDNIVIPYSVAASTRVEKLQYKEILTPKWRLVDPDFAVKCETKNNGVVRNSSQDSDAEDTSEEAVLIRHDKCEHDEKKKFLSYLKLPIGYGRGRTHKRTDSRAESSGANTPDPLSPHAGDHLENTTSPITSPPATPLSINTDDSLQLPSVSVMRKRTISQTRWQKDKEFVKDESSSSVPEQIDVAPYEKREFPLSEEMFEKMLKHMPENHQFKTNIRAQDSRDYNSPVNYFDETQDSPDSESTESAIGEEDPNDPEWIDMERIGRDRHKR